MGIEHVTVIGAGVMGGGIAAQIANAGIPVLLLDVVPDGAADRDQVAKQAIARMLKADPAPFMSKRAAKRVTPGNIDDHLDRAADSDWIVEAVVERPDVKQALYAKIEKVRKKGSIVSSNTSTLPRAVLVDGMPKSFAADFLITHFFNPPRYMRLLEVVSGPENAAGTVAAFKDFADRRLGKGVVDAHDTPGFIANRIGTFWIQCAIVEAMDRGLSIEEADACMGRPLGIPKTGVFGLMDLVGIDLMPYVDQSLANALPADDAYMAIRREVPLIARMIADGYTGRKGKGGFYRLNTEGGGRVKEAIDLATGAYAPAAKPALESLRAARGGARALVSHADKGGQYAWAVMSKTLAYAASLVPEIADDVDAVDRAMRLGYNWKKGPFELIDDIGSADMVARLGDEGADVPEFLKSAAEAQGFYKVEAGRRQMLSLDGTYRDIDRPDGVTLLADAKLASPPLARNGSASLWDVGDGVACFEIHTKLNSIDQEVMGLLRKAIGIVAKDFKALVIYNEGSHFSAGANIGLTLFAANTAMWPMIEDQVAQGQKIYAELKRAPFPVVAAPSGLALGGGCEILLHADAVQAHAESYVGLVETGVGLVPAWGGCKEMLMRLAADPKRPNGPMAPVAQAFQTIGLADVAKSAFEAQEKGFMRAADGITFNRDRLLADAKAKALDLAEGYAPPEPVEFALPGPSGKAAIGLALDEFRAKGMLTPHDEIVADALADVLTGGPKADHTEPIDEDTVLKLERAAFMRLVRTEPTLARMEHTLETGKPLRN